MRSIFRPAIPFPKQLAACAIDKSIFIKSGFGVSTGERLNRPESSPTRTFSDAKFPEAKFEPPTAFIGTTRSIETPGSDKYSKESSEKKLDIPFILNGEKLKITNKLNPKDPADAKAASEFCSRNFACWTIFGPEVRAEAEEDVLNSLVVRNEAGEIYATIEINSTYGENRNSPPAEAFDLWTEGDKTGYWESQLSAGAPPGIEQAVVEAVREGARMEGYTYLLRNTAYSEIKTAVKDAGGSLVGCSEMGKGWVVMPLRTLS